MSMDFTFPDREEEPEVNPPLVYVQESLPWEYKVVTQELSQQPPLGEGALNEQGQDGWELTGVITVAGNAVYYFKRPAG